VTSSCIGTLVNLIVEGTPSCNGRILNFEVRRVEPTGDIYVTHTYTNTFIGDVTSGLVPISIYMDSESASTFYFIAYELYNPNTEYIRSNNLVVSRCPDCGNKICGAGEDCSKCVFDCGACCGNRVCDFGETCKTCELDCGACPPVIFCGDKICNNGEDCKSCGRDCGACPPECGNGILEPSNNEQCDDMNTVSGDCCSSTCRIESGCSIQCGNGVIETGETCDDSNTISGDCCSATCHLEPACTIECGNGILETGEGCDDGNLINGDGCSAFCNPEDELECGDGDVQWPEECDDENTISGDGCSSTCTYEGIPPRCGNGVKEGVEECDDGNNVNGDGCSATCTKEGGGPGGCTPESDARFCNDMGVECGSAAGNDNCNDPRTVDDCGSCTYPEICNSNGQCTTTCTDTCGSLGYQCETQTVCGSEIYCGDCIFPKTCQGETCICTSESDARFCNDRGIECGSAAGTDNCNNPRTVDNCGSCNDGLLCTDNYCSDGTCQVSAKDCSDTNLCTTDGCAISTGICYHNPINCADTDSCTNDYCSGGICEHDNTCECTEDSDCTGSECRVGTCSGGSCTYTDIDACRDGDECCNPSNGCNSLNDNDCPTICGNDVIDQSWEECDGSDLGGESCINLGYTGGDLSCSSCSFNVNLCTSPCDLTSAYWSTTSAFSGNPISLFVEGSSSCNGKIISFAIWRDRLFGAEYVVDAVTDIFSDGASSSWVTIAPYGGDSTPTYFFRASDGSDIIQSNNLDVTESVTCPNTYCDSGETCANCPDDCGSCCGNGILDLGEDCDDSNLVNGDGCSSTCTNEGPPGCGNGIKEGTEQCDDGNTVSGDGCSATCTDEMIPPGECTITSLAWNQTTAFEGETVRLNIAGTNCESETFSFEVLEHDGFLNGPDSVIREPNPITFSSDSYGTWIAEWQNDDEGALGGQTNPPEYYFKVTVGSTGESTESSKQDENMLKVFQKEVFCFGIDYCSNYLTQIDCEADLCNVGLNSIPEEIICGSRYNELTGCNKNIDCGCAWNFYSGLCEGKWDLRETCEEEKLLGMCSYTENSDDTCEDDGWLVRSLDASWRWDLNNNYPAVPAGEDESNYLQDPPGTYRYDPDGDSLNCKGKDETFACPAQVQLPFFGFYQLVIAIAVILLIYLTRNIKQKYL
jgi:cysteine-rich repeat protein